MRFLKILSFISCTLGGVVLVTTQAHALLVGPSPSQVNSSDNFGNQAQEIVGGINTPLPVQVAMGEVKNTVMPLVYDEHFATVKSDSDLVSTVVLNGGINLNTGSLYGQAQLDNGGISNEITPLDGANEIPEPSSVMGLTAIVSLITINTLFKKGGKK